MKKIVLLIVLIALIGCSEKAEVNIENSEEWCAEGTTWNSEIDEGTADMEVIGIVDSGKYEGLCHVHYTIDMQEASGTVDAYFDEDGNGYQVIDVNGQKLETEISN